MHTDVEVSKTKTVRQKAQTGLKKERGKNRKKEKESDKHEQTKDNKKNLKNSKNITQPLTAKVQLSILHYETVTHC